MVLEPQRAGGPPGAVGGVPLRHPLNADAPAPIIPRNNRCNGLGVLGHVTGHRLIGVHRGQGHLDRPHNGVSDGVQGDFPLLDNSFGH